MTRFSTDFVVCHIRRKHPGCPEFAVRFFAAEIAKKDWQRASLGKAVGITMQNYLRHKMTEYDTLLLTGMNRLEARRRVQPRINAMLNSWRRTPKPLKTGHSEEADHV